MATTEAPFLDIYRRLLDHFEPQNWWPGDTPYEVIVGAVLTQRTAWTNVEQAIGNLKAAGALTLRGMLKLHPLTLRKLVRPTGYYNQKAARLGAVTRWLVNRFNGDVSKATPIATGELRAELLAINGIGPETADSILLYAFNRPVFVVDAYTVRALQRIGVAEERMNYQRWQALLESRLPRDTTLFNDFHAQFVALGKNYCRTDPLCRQCPLNSICRTGREKTSTGEQK